MVGSTLGKHVGPVFCSEPACFSPLSLGVGFCTWASLAPQDFHLALLLPFAGGEPTRTTAFQDLCLSRAYLVRLGEGLGWGEGERVQSEEKERPCLVSETLFFPPRQIIACVTRGGTQQGGPTGAYGPSSNSIGGASPLWLRRKWAVHLYINWFYTVLQEFWAFAGLRGGPVRNGRVLGVELMIPIQFTQSGSILISQDWISLGVSVYKRVLCPKDIWKALLVERLED